MLLWKHCVKYISLNIKKTLYKFIPNRKQMPQYITLFNSSKMSNSFWGCPLPARRECVGQSLDSRLQHGSQNDAMSQCIVQTLIQCSANTLYCRISSCCKSINTVIVDLPVWACTDHRIYNCWSCARQLTVHNECDLTRRNHRNSSDATVRFALSLGFCLCRAPYMHHAGRMTHWPDVENKIYKSFFLGGVSLFTLTVFPCSGGSSEMYLPCTIHVCFFQGVFNN